MKYSWYNLNATLLPLTHQRRGRLNECCRFVEVGLRCPGDRHAGPSHCHITSGTCQNRGWNFQSVLLNILHDKVENIQYISKPCRWIVKPVYDTAALVKFSSSTILCGMIPTGTLTVTQTEITNAGYKNSMKNLSYIRVSLMTSVPPPA